MTNQEVKQLSCQFDYINESNIKINGLSNVNQELSTHYLIYRIDNLKNGKHYIGQHRTNNPCDSYMGSSKIVNYAIMKYGIENFIKTILFDFQSFELMNNKERELVPLVSCYPYDKLSYNLKEGGGYLSEEITKSKGIKISKSLKNPNGKRKNMSNDKIAIWKRKISIAQKNFSSDKKILIQNKRKHTIQQNWNLKSQKEKDEIHKKRSQNAKIAQKNLSIIKKKEKSRKCSIASKKYWNSISEQELKNHSLQSSQQMINRFKNISNLELEHFKHALSKTKTGSKYMSKNGQQKFFMKNEIDQALKDGWVFDSPDRSQYKGTSYWNDGIHQKRIHKTDEEKYQNLGWKKGRLKKLNKSYSNYNKALGKKWIHKGNKSMQISKELLQYYLDNGWNLGRK